MSLLPFSSQLIADVGISLGDEGKGRLIPEVADELRGTAHPVSVVLKVNGGANSGHTAGGIKLNLLPAGVVVRDAAHLCIGSGVVADPRKIWWETKPLEKKGHAILSRLLVDERTLVSDLTHRLLDLAWEDYRVNVLAEEPRGSTGRGITPAYLDEVGQQQITFSDFLAGPNYFARKLAQRADRACRTIQHVCRVSEATWASFFDKLTAAELRANAEAIELGVFTKDEFDFTRFRGPAPFTLNLEALTATYWAAGTALARNIGEVRELILREVHAGRTVIGEFGQAYWLDKRHGFSPNVTASHTYTPEFFESAGIPVQRIHTFGVAKAYDTKVGTHTFITRMDDAHPLADRLKRMINASGFKVWPAEVENQLFAHPAIQEACVIGTRDAYRGETVKAVVVLRPESKGQVSPDEIEHWARERMAAYKVPRVIEFAEGLPKSGSGKVMWRLLQEQENARTAPL